MSWNHCLGSDCGPSALGPQTSPLTSVPQCPHGQNENKFGCFIGLLSDLGTLLAIVFPEPLGVGPADSGSPPNCSEGVQHSPKSAIFPGPLGGPPDPPTPFCPPHSQEKRRREEEAAAVVGPQGGATRVWLPEASGLPESVARQPAQCSRPPRRGPYQAWHQWKPECH